MPTFNVRQFVPGAVIGLAGHALPFATGFLTGKVVQPSSGGGFEDLAAVVVMFLLAEAAVCLAAIAGGAILASRGRRHLGLGVIAGWMIGVIALIIVWRIQR